jgi:NADPH2:quinone reductase
MRAAQVHELGSPPRVAEVAEPEGATLEVLAAPLNPIDLAVSRGVYFGGHPELPYVPGCEAVGRSPDGRTVWVFSGGLGLDRNGAMAERAAIGNSIVIEIPRGADPALASALGIAGLAGWLPLAWRAPLEGGETVLVLGATGTVGLVAVQTAKLRGASRVVAVGRSAEGLERATALGADATVQLSDDLDLVAAFRDAFDGEGPSYVFDPLWGAPGAAAVQAAAPHARVVQLGQSAGPEATIASGAVRGKNLTIFGLTTYRVPSDELAEQYARLVGHAVAGDIALEVEQVPLDAVAEAWQRQADGNAGKLVVIP